MSKRIKTRKVSQCKSHHQKLIKFCGTVEGVIGHLTKILSPLTA